MHKTHAVTPWIASLLLVASMVSLTPSRAQASDRTEHDTAVPKVASDEEAASGLAAFKTAFAARGLKGEERASAKAQALIEIAEIQHPDVVDLLAKHTRNRDPYVRTAALLQLGKQRAFPGYAGIAVLSAMKSGKKDLPFVLVGLSGIEHLRYLGASKWLLKLTSSSDYAVAKAAISTVSRLKDPRLTEQLIRLLKKLRITKGVSWDGYHATWRTGAVSDVSKEKADQIRAEGKARAKAGKAAAAKAKRASRGMRDLGVHVLEALSTMTGEKFTGAIDARAWLRANQALVAADIKVIKKRDEAQLRAAKALKSRPKTKRR